MTDPNLVKPGLKPEPNTHPTPPMPSPEGDAEATTADEPGDSPMPRPELTERATGLEKPADER